MNIWVWKNRNNEKHSHVSGIMNKTFVYVHADTVSAEALYLYDEIFIFVKNQSAIRKGKLHQNYNRLIPKLQTWTILESARQLDVMTNDSRGRLVIAWYLGLVLVCRRCMHGRFAVFCWSM